MRQLRSTMVDIDILNRYFRYLCVQHPLLQHGSASGQRVFETHPLESAFSAIRTGGKAKSFLVRLLLPTKSYRADGDNARVVYQVGLLVLKYHSIRDQEDADTIAALAAAESVSDQLMMRMVADSREGVGPLAGRNDSVDGLDAQCEFVLAEMDGSYSGVLTTFNIHVTRKVANECQTVVWPDGGNTPTPLPA